MSYSEKLRDPRWQRKRLEIMQRDNWTCQVCGEKNKTLAIHHLFYMGDPWEIDDFWLITVCEYCHEKLEDEKDKALTDGDYERLYKNLEARRKLDVEYQKVMIRLSQISQTIINPFDEQSY